MRWGRLPHEVMSLPAGERAFVFASIETMLANEAKAAPQDEPRGGAAGFRRDVLER